MGIKTIFSQIREQLSGKVPELAFGVNRGQLEDEQAGLTFPCVLVDVAQAGYTEASHGTQVADVAVSVTVAAMPSSDDQLIAFDLIDRVHASLQHLGSGDYAPLVRTGMARAKSVAGIDAFTLTYGTQYMVGPAAEGNTMHTVSPDIVDLQMT